MVNNTEIETKKTKENQILQKYPKKSTFHKFNQKSSES